MTSPLAGVLAGMSRSGFDLRVGTVSSTSPLVVSLATGDLSPTARLASYTPSGSDVVLVLTSTTGTAVVLGKLVGT